jgi:hypothetical protein
MSRVRSIAGTSAIVRRWANDQAHELRPSVASSVASGIWALVLRTIIDRSQGQKGPELVSDLHQPPSKKKMAIFLDFLVMSNKIFWANSYFFFWPIPINFFIFIFYF